MALGLYTQPEKFPELLDRVSWDQYRMRCPEEIDPKIHYDWMKTLGLEYGPLFQGITRIFRGTTEALVFISLPERLREESQHYQIHPVLLDACFQAIAIAASRLKNTDESISYLPVGFDRIDLSEELGTEFWCFAEIDSGAQWGSSSIQGQLTLLSQEGAVLGRIEGFKVARMDRNDLDQKNLFYDLKWKKSEWSLTNTQDTKACWVIVNDRYGTGDQLKKLLDQYEADTILVSNPIVENNPNHWKHRWHELLSEIQGQKAQIVFLKGLDYSGALWTSESLEKAEREMTSCLLTLIQTLIDQSHTSARIWTVTSGAQSLDDQTPISVAQSSLWGFTRTLAVAHPEYWGGLIDLDPYSQPEQRAKAIYKELLTKDGEDQILIRGSNRYVARLVQKEWKAQGKPLYVRPDASTLITGGLGELGLKFARWLVKKGARHLVLVGRTPLPPREDWSSIEKGDRFYRQIQGVLELEAMGAQVELAFFDVADEVKVRDYLIRHQLEGKKPIRGIFHLAGIVQNQSFSELTEEDLWRIYRPKVLGAWNLHQLFPAGTLDFFILFSSFTSLISPPRLAAYAGANAFMDALAKERSRLDHTAVSIAWGPWAEGGMAVRSEDQGQVVSNMTAGMKNMSPDQGLAMFETIWNQPTPFVAVADVDWKEWSKWFEVASQAPLLQELITSDENQEEAVHPSTNSFRQTLSQTDPDHRQQLIVQFLREQVAEVLRLDVEALSPHHSLSQLGLDSMMAVELQNRINRELIISLPMVAFLSGPTVKELSEKVEQLFVESLETKAEEYELTAALDQKKFPLSYGQRSLWFLHQMAPQSAAYHVGFAIKIESEMDIPAFKRAWEQVIFRQPALRTIFSVENGEPVQIVQDHVDGMLEVVDASTWDEAALRDRMDQDYRLPFDLSQGPIWRGILYCQKADQAVFLLVVHHIAIDFWGIEVLLDELRRFYEAEVTGKPAGLDPLPATYADFVHWQSQLLNGEEGKRQEEHWRTTLAGELIDLQLPTDKLRPKHPSYHGASVPFILESNLTQQLKEWARQENVTMFVVLLAAFQVLLHRYSGQKEVIVGSPVTGRSRPEFEHVVGDFINMLPYRTDFTDDPTFQQLIKKVQEMVLKGLEHQDYPFPLMVEKLKPQRDTSRSPIFQVSFILQNLVRFKELAQFMIPEKSEAELDFGGLTIRPFPINQQEGQMDITLEMGEANGQLFGVWKYSTDLFNQETIERMAAHFKQVLKQILVYSDEPVSKIAILPKEEKLSLLEKGQGQTLSGVHGLLLHELFERQVDQTPDRVAIEFDGETLTYAELDQRANQLARRMKSLGIKKESTVGICVDRSLDMVVALLAALKAGTTYVPMDPTFPKQRLAWMLEDAQMSALLTEEKWIPYLPSFDGQMILLDRDREQIELELTDRLENEIDPDALSYIIFTSGSTGRPKGVEISHLAVVNFMKSMQDKPGIHKEDVWVAVTTLSFDIALLELFLPLTVGAKVVIASRETALDGTSLLQLMDDVGATILQATPATWRLLLEAGWQGKKDLKILCGGEALPKELMNELLPRCESLWNMYGPTEATIWMTVEKLETTDETITIGRPIHNMEAYILDEHLQPVPIGVVGELYIGGIGLARGYHRRPDLTDEKFIPHPFQENGRLYKSGDLARLLPDGRIECLGRIDHQVKIRGFRIELGDIEAALAHYEGIRQAVVVAHDDPSGEKRLVAYYVGDSSITVEHLRQHLAKQLPDYMIPSIFMPLDEMPLTPNGKVDRKALPAPDVSKMKREYVELQNETETMIAEIWAQVLQVENVGALDHFFELGGTSLLAAKVHRLLMEKVEKPLTIIDLFQYPTVRALAEYIDQGDKNSSVEDRTAQLQKGKNRLQERLKRRKALNKRS